MGPPLKLGAHGPPPGPRGGPLGSLRPIGVLEAPLGSPGETPLGSLGTPLGTPPWDPLGRPPGIPRDPPWDPKNQNFEKIYEKMI